MPKNKRHSKQKKRIEQIFADNLNLHFHAIVYRQRSGSWSYGQNKFPRYWFQLGKEIIWDYPHDFSHLLNKAAGQNISILIMARNTTDFLQTMAVFLILFVFVAIICFTAVMVILYTRSMTIAMTNRQIYEDLGKLGASKTYLYGTVKNQISRIFVAPIATGTAIISMFYTIVLYFNSGGVSTAELGVNCLLIVLGMSVLFYFLYRFILSRVCRNLGLQK